ncbi:MAG: hypothetical protein AAGA99_24820 [Actinomycetota bacterium]
MNEPSESFLASLPRKRMAAGIVFLRADRRVLLADPAAELSEWRWFGVADAVSVLADRVGRRLTACLVDGEPATGLYLEDQVPV